MSIFYQAPVRVRPCLPSPCRLQDDGGILHGDARLNGFGVDSPTAKRSYQEDNLEGTCNLLEMVVLPGAHGIY